MPERSDEPPSISRLLIRMSTRRCRGCGDPSPHSHHLTLLGRWRYVWRHHA